MKYALFVSFCMVLILGCDSNEEDPIILEAPRPRFVADTSYTVKASGLKLFDFAIGDTTRVSADPGDLVRIQFDAWLVDGDTSFFETSVLTGPIEFTLGNNEVIDGWEEGINGMFLGGDRQLVIPPSLAYGEEGFNNIPGNATLIYEIGLLGTQ